jgi:Concanavalin A-like lectin/glucanases superfamily/Fibronectin type III domain
MKTGTGFSCKISCKANRLKYISSATVRNCLFTAMDSRPHHKSRLLMLWAALALPLSGQTLSAQNVTLGWPATTDPQIAGYDIYYGTASGNYTSSIAVGDTTSVTISNLVVGTTYYFAATSLNGQNQQSALSAEISYTVPPPQTSSSLGPIFINLSSTVPSVRTAQNQLTLNVPVLSNYQYVVEVSTNLLNWVALATNSSPFTFVDSYTSQYRQRFYRACYSPNVTTTSLSNYTNGLVAWYPLNGNLNDASTNGNNATGAGAIAYVPGPLNAANTALAFDGADTYVYDNNLSSTIANSPGISMTGWIHPNNTNAVYGCYGFRAPSDGPGAFYIDLITPYDYEARFRNSSGTAVTLNAPYAPGSWIFAGLTYDGSTLTLYTNGVAAASAPASGNFGVSNLPFYLGGTGYFGPTANLPNFPMSGVRLYNSALSPAIMGQLYTNGIVNGVF